MIGAAPAPALLDRRRFARLAGVGVAQAGVQATGFVAGLVLVRTMEPLQYGHYTLALSLVGVGTVLGDLGLGTAVMARGGRLPADAAALGGLLADARVLQRRLTLGAGALLVPGAFAALLGLDVALREAAVLAALVAATAALGVRAGLALALLRVLGHVGFQQRLELAVSVTRLLLVAALAGVALNAALACAVNALAALIAGLGLRAHLRPRLAVPPLAPRTHLPALRAHVARQAPNSIYYLVSGQIVIWLVGLFGGSERIAEVGALGRLAALFGVLGAVAAALVLPWFARPRQAHELRAALGAVHAFHAGLLLALLMLAQALPDVLLALLGRHYAGLGAELPWVVASATLTAWAGTLYSVGCARGWVLPFAWSAGTGLLATALAAASVDLSSVRGAFIVNTVSGATAVVVAWGYLRREARREVRP